MLTSLKKFFVSSKYSGERLQNFLKMQLEEEFSGKSIKKLIDSYGCKINGKVEVFSSSKVSKGDVVEVELKRLGHKETSKTAILYENDDYLICNKSASTPSDEKLLGEQLKRKSLFLVHRLDKDTTGVMVLAKTREMKQAFEELFRKREVEKVYHAIVQGRSSSSEFKVENALIKLESYEGQGIWGSTSSSEGLYALTYFKVLKNSRENLLIECKPYTGRTHQIRVHLSEKRLPIVGDCHYFKKDSFSYFSQRPLLHAHSIRFIDPKSQKEIFVTAPYPEDFTKAERELF